MCALGQKRTSEHDWIMSALPAKANIEVREAWFVFPTNIAAGMPPVTLAAHFNQFSNNRSSARRAPKLCRGFG